MQGTRGNSGGFLLPAARCFRWRGWLQGKSFAAILLRVHQQAFVVAIFANQKLVCRCTDDISIKTYLFLLENYCVC